MVLTATEETTQILSKTRPWQHQIDAFNFAYRLRGAMLAMEMGCGKSKVVVDLVTNRNHRRVLILCPKSVVQVWPKQFSLHSPVPVAVLTLDGPETVAQKAKKAAEFLAQGRNISVIVINYESAWREDFAEFAKNKAKFDLMVMDESHRIKAPGGKASRFCSQLCEKVPWRLALTGTPMPQNPLDIYAQYRALNKIVFGTSYARFSSQYAELDQFHRPTRWKNREEFNNKFYSLAFRVKSADVLDLPEAMHETRTFELSPSAKKMYQSLERQFQAWLDTAQEKEVTVTNALTKLLRLQQFTSGYAQADGGELVEVDSGKRELLKEILEDLDKDEPVVVFCKFQRDLDAVHEVAHSLERRSMELSGRRNELAIWQAGATTVLAVQIQAGGVGIDLTRSRYTVYYSLGFSLGDYEQSLARTHRPGQKGNCVFYHLLAENTVDEEVMQALESKKNVVESILTKRGGK